ncbi:hypothetical protein J2T07_002895 [Luteibacter jiangsuensis]|uniref:Uncharacterized protein n=1 Tax=Luteibacter jiangsuensis TaxID=637577 RepID=A0ABT9T1J9_9GAMM|nr:hypothetical protein [Luteibacter jiangsuensis]MDQ0010689.1 hypothetical protein [Luteibacter jiangsuensis]
MKPILALTALSLLATAAVAQEKPLNLRLPADYVPASSSSTAPPATTQGAAGTAVTKSGESVAVTPSRPKDPPGTYYGDTSGRMAGADVEDAGPRCDDATYNKPQVHGSVSTGVVSASHGGSGNYQAGTVSLSQAFGSCEHPTGGVSISVGGGTGHFGGGRIR